MFIELTQVIDGVKLEEPRTLVNASKIAQVSRDGDTGKTLIQFGLSERGYILVSESYEYVRRIIFMEANKNESK